MSALTPLLYQMFHQHRGKASFGSTSTAVAGVDFFWSCRLIERSPIIYRPSIVIIGQGHKVGYLGGRRFRYDPSTFLVVGLPIFFECESHGSVEDPLLGVRINIDTLSLHKLVAKIGGPLGLTCAKESGTHTGIEATTMDEGMTQATERLLTYLQDPLDCKVLAPGARDEIIYRTLRSQKGQVLYDLTQHHTQYAAIARVLDRVHVDYQEAVSVDELAREAGMSASAFHRAFKEATGQSPLQYIKKIRLDRARGLLLHRQLPVKVVAYEVGYESPSQFSREFKRHFQVSPSSLRSRETEARSWAEPS